MKRSKNKISVIVRKTKKSTVVMQRLDRDRVVHKVIGHKLISFSLLFKGKYIITAASNERMLQRKFRQLYMALINAHYKKYGSFSIEFKRKMYPSKVMEEFLLLVFMERLRKSGFI